MVLLTVSLQQGWVELEWVQTVSQGLLHFLGLLFVPPGVGLMLYGDLLQQEWHIIALANLASTLAVLISVGALHQLLAKN